MKTLLEVRRVFSPVNSPHPFLNKSPFDHHGRGRKSVVSVFRSSLPGEDALQMFLRDRQLNGDFVSKASDIIWRRDELKFIDLEDNVFDENSQQMQLQEVMETENDGGFLKLTKTLEWVSGDETAPVNRKQTFKEIQDDRERRKKLNLLQYDAIKKELTLLTAAVGTFCTGYCLVVFSIQAAISYATGVLFSFLYLQLLYFHVDNLTREAVPQIFRQKKVKKIGIRSEDLQNFFETTLNGSGFVLSSPRLVIPAAIYGLWGLSTHFSNDLFSFQLVPAMFGLFAYKAAALVQVYRDNDDLKLIFPGADEYSNE
ncbi:uncharacterized protein LOC113321204 isoform X2 [Papaver somniferum]|uniref:uncharacterized protein LOC113321204 isoform X2 n=1 Tax=Papaver somniferum TaxID=3469 RepID=UPI000E6F4BCC|nr:uncharacterized protein LOC113321204 isoform X2 [Papaver somniferum]